MDSRVLNNLNYWLTDDYFCDASKNELRNIQDNPKEIEDRFYKDLEFGTGGLRGIIGAGSNRMNVYTVRKASQGIANYIVKKGSAYMAKGIVIAYDNRRMSTEFASEAARIFTANGIKTYLFDELRPTPELSFAVRELGTAAGVMITASHNPKEYNGYKVYGEDGGQIPLDAAEALMSEIKEIEPISNVRLISIEDAKKNGLLKIVGKEIDDAYIGCLKALVENPGLLASEGNNLKIVYTPIHGAGNRLVRRILSETDFSDVIVVKEQELPDPEFSTVKSPNPEERSAFDLAIALAEKENADIILGTDPDSDRLGAVVRNKSGEYVVLTGNQLGSLMLEYILKTRKQHNVLKPCDFAVKTIVTTELAQAIADNYGIKLFNVLTGFKFIGEKIKEMELSGNYGYIFGFEESYGYLAGTFARDKDAVGAALLASETAAHYRSRGMSLYEGLLELFSKYGYYQEGLKTLTLPGKQGLETIKRGMEKLRENRTQQLSDCFTVTAIFDYQTGKRYFQGQVGQLDLPQSDVLYYQLEDASWLCVRPSGTEPKLKIYYGVKASHMEECRKKINIIEEWITDFTNKYLS